MRLMSKFKRQAKERTRSTKPKVGGRIKTFDFDCAYGTILSVGRTSGFLVTELDNHSKIFMSADYAKNWIELL